jgi:integrase
MPVIKLTQEGIGKLRCPEGKRSVQICDAQHRGLLLELRRTDQEHPTWYVRYKNESKCTKYVRLGRFPDVSLSNARARAKDVQAEIRLGADPRAEENAKKAVPTFSEFFEEQYIPHVKTRKRTWKKDQEYFNLRLKAAFGHKRLNQIRRREIQLFHSSLHAEGLAPATCNHYLKLMKRTLNLAIQWEIIEGPNSAVGIQQYKEMNLKETYLDDQTLPKLLSVIKIDKNKTVCFIILFLLSTGARLNEALQARWEDIDIEKRVWRIPASSAKSGRSRAIALNEMSIDVLNGLDTKNGFEYLFINKQTGRPYTTIQKVWNRLRNKADLKHVRIHDLRHSYASYLINNGFSLFSVSCALGHSNPLITKRYAHLSAKSLQDAADSASDVIKEAMKKTA